MPVSSESGTCESCGIEVLCNKGGAGSLTCCDREMKLKKRNRCHRPTERPVLLLDHARVRPDPWAPLAEAVAFASGRVLAVGSSASVRAQVGRRARVIDCRRRRFPG
jgi:hypothetical protein